MRLERPVITVGSLFTGYGGLDLGLSLLTWSRTAWTSDVEPGPCAVIAARFPDAPNLGDVTSVGWGDVERVDVLAGGSPCQDMSTAGKRAGMRSGTRSGLWSAMVDAVMELRPSLVAWENVPGARSAAADTIGDRYVKDHPSTGGVGRADRGVGDRPRPALRALGRVLGDLAGCGYDAQWLTLSAAAVGAPHLRRRVFILAHRRGSADAQRLLRDWAGDARGRRDEPTDGGKPPVGALLPTPTARDSKGAGLPREGGPTLHDALLPTPAVNDMCAGKDVAQWDAWTAAMRELHGNGNGHGRSLSVEARRYADELGPYAEACARWAELVGRPVPPPTDEEGRLSARFVEWMMGLPDGWVTAVDGASRTRQLRLLGNGVVPQQAAAAYRMLAGWALAG